MAATRWPWLRRAGAADDLVGELYDAWWPKIKDRKDLTPDVRDLAQRLVGKAGNLPPAPGDLNLTHGDAATRNFRTGQKELVLLDWEDATAAPGIADIAWLLVSSTPPARWPEILDKAPTEGLPEELATSAVQGLLSLTDHDQGTPEAQAQINRLTEAAHRLKA